MKDGDELKVFLLGLGSSLMVLGGSMLLLMLCVFSLRNFILWIPITNAEYRGVILCMACMLIGGVLWFLSKYAANKGAENSEEGKQ